MKQMFSAAAEAFAFAVSVSAQTTPPPQSQTQTPSTGAQHSSAKKDSKKMSKANVTLTGCLRQGASPDTFELNNVQMIGDMSSMHQEHHGTSGSSTSSQSSTSTGASSQTGSGTSTGMSAGMSATDIGTVKLLTNADIDLKDHVGHQVEVGGTLSGGGMMTKDKGSASSSDTMGSGSSASSSSATGTSDPNATGTSGTDKDAKNPHTLKVRSLRHVSDTCSQ